ncbi:MAG: FMN-binding protein [Deltaproteobacteria bacterium]|nr:FMN-binding protein [Deltaproteobacteria bacterium]
MKEILKITFALTVSCLIAAAVMGLTFTVTAKAKKHNEHMNVQETMQGLLGYGKNNPVPEDMTFHSVYRYIIEEGENKYLGYMVPVAEGSEEGYVLVLLDLGGNFVKKLDLTISPEAAQEEPEREAALKAVLDPSAHFTYGDTIVIAKRGEKRVAYLLPGEFPGFKTFIQVMLALDPQFTILGLEIMEHEEDPGLGGEIVQEYFKNQFRDKKFDKVKALKVVKVPLPEEYKKYLEKKKWKEGMFTEEQIQEIRKKYEDKDIYALTGATISSRSVTNGVKNMVKKFAYRVGKLEDALAKQHIQAAF